MSSNNCWIGRPEEHARQRKRGNGVPGWKKVLTPCARVVDEDAVEGLARCGGLPVEHVLELAFCMDEAKVLRERFIPLEATFASSPSCGDHASDV